MQVASRSLQNVEMLQNNGITLDRRKTRLSLRGASGEPIKDRKQVSVSLDSLDSKPATSSWK